MNKLTALAKRFCFSSRRLHTIWPRDWSSDVCSSDLIAIPTFLGARQRAQDRAAQSDLRNGLTAEKTVYTDSQTYSTDTTTAGLKGVESSLDWGGKLAVSTSPDNLSVWLTEASQS